MTAPIDLERLAQFSDGTPEGVRSLGEIFLHDVAETLAELAAAVAAEQRAEIEILAHRAAGACGACGATRLSEQLRALEELARGGRVEGARVLFSDIAHEMQQVTLYLRAHVDGIGNSP